MEGAWFWAAAGVMALAVLAVLLQALRRHPPATAVDADLNVYRDQLREVERDRDRGVIAAAEAERLRYEVSRRLLEADRIKPQTRPTVGAVPIAAVLVILSTLTGSAWLYSRLGAPGYPDFALATRLAFADEIYRTRPNQDQAEAVAPTAPDATDAALIERRESLRATLQTTPDDPETLGDLALAEAGLGDMIAARVSQARMIEMKGAAANANDLAALGWMMIAAAGGYVSPEAEAVLIRALEQDPQNGLALYYSGLMFAQVGRPDRAFALWRPLLEQGPATAPWITPIRSGIEELAARAGIRYALPDAGPGAGALAGPSAADVTEAATMTPEDRQTMIQSMVTGLADRLASEGGPPADWARLITSLAMLGQLEQARAIFIEAQGHFATDAAALALVEAAGQQAGLSE